MPQALRDRPVLTSRQNYFRNVYNEISRSRQLSQAGAMPLGVEQIESYTNYFGIFSLDEREDIFLFVGAMDEVYMEVVNAKKEK